MQKYDWIAVGILMICLIVVMFCLHVIDAEGELIRLVWDPPQETHDGVRIFQKTARAGDAYDYTDPVVSVLTPKTEALIDVPGEENAVLKYQWVARAYRDDIESIDSNEVAYKVVNIPPLTPIGLTGIYDAEKQIITLSWQQPTDDWAIDHWFVYSRDSPVDDWQQIGRVDDGHRLELISPIVAPAGEITSIEFGVVAFRRSGVYSADSLPFEIKIDRREVAPIRNLRIEIEIPL